MFYISEDLGDIVAQGRNFSQIYSQMAFCIDFKFCTICVYMYVRNCVCCEANTHKSNQIVSN